MDNTIKNLNIYYSSGCDSNCTCCIMRGQPNINNKIIQTALEDGTFAHYVRQALTQDTISLSILGSNPSINGQYFNTFITSILDYSPYIYQIFIPTNGQSDTFYTDFIAPVLIYCLTHRREIIMQLEFNLDGPPDLHDKYHGVGSHAKCIKTLQNIQNISSYNKYLHLYIKTKSILHGKDLETYSAIKWFNIMHEYQDHFTSRHYERWGETPQYIEIKPMITVEIPGQYTAEQGRNLKQWIDPEDGIFFKTDGTYCHIGENSKSIDCYGNIYDCQIFMNENFNLAHLRENFEEKMNNLVINGEAIEQNRDKLFNAIMSIYCWTIKNNDIPESYIKLLGNGVLL